MRDDIVCRAKRRIEPGEFVTADDVDFLPGGSTVIDVPHEHVDVKVAVPADMTPGEVLGLLSSPTRVTEAVAVPSHIKTMGDFFDEENGMGRVFAERIADKIYGPDPCGRCGSTAKTTEKFPGRKLCAECAPLEY